MVSTIERFWAKSLIHVCLVLLFECESSAVERFWVGGFELMTGVAALECAEGLLTAFKVTDGCFLCRCRINTLVVDPLQLNLLGQYLHVAFVWSVDLMKCCHTVDSIL